MGKLQENVTFDATLVKNGRHEFARIPQGLKPRLHLEFAARLKSCPVTKPATIKRSKAKWPLTLWQAAILFPNSYSLFLVLAVHLHYFLAQFRAA
jgi:hypothetical protein